MRSHHRSIAKSAGAIGGLTAVSRVLGFIRDLVIATAFGTGVNAEAFVVAFKVPNLLRDLVGEGATNAAVVPVLTEIKEKRTHEFWGIVSTLFFILLGVVLVLALLGVIFTPFLVKILAPGFAVSADPEKFPLTVRLTRVLFPYIVLIGLTALAMGVLNSQKEFISSMFGPILLNLCMIIAGYFFQPYFGPMALVVGILLGGVLQLSCQIPPLFKKGFKLRRPQFNHPAVKRIGKLLIPRAFGSAVYQMNVFVDSILASFESLVGSGGQSALYYSNRLFQLPLAIFGISAAQVILPTFSSQMARGDLPGFKETFLLALRMLMLVVLPASVGLVVLSTPIVRIIFEHGRFDAYSTSITSSALFFYAFGLLSCCFIKILANAFYSLQDTRTPVKTALFAVGLNIVLCSIFMGPLKIGGLALASTLSATANMALLYWRLRKRVGGFDEGTLMKAFLKTLAASLGMGLFAWGYSHWVLSKTIHEARHTQGLFLAAGIVVSVLIYLALALMLKIEGVKKIFLWRRNSSLTV